MPSLLVYASKTVPCNRVLVMLPGFGNSVAPFAKLLSKKPKEDNNNDTAVIVSYGAMFSTFTELASQIWTALAAQGFTNNIVLIGYSMGGFVAQHVAKQYPQAVVGVVLACTACPEKGMLPLTKKGKALEILQTFASKSVAMWFLPKDERYMAMSKTFHPYEDKCMAVENNAQMHAILQYTSESTDRTVAEACGSLTQPVLLLHGDKDTVLSVDNARAMHKALPNSQLYVFANIGHGLLNQHGEVIMILIDRWMSASVPLSALSPSPSPSFPSSQIMSPGYSFSLV